MKKLLIIPMAIIELITLALGWVIAFIHRESGGKWVNWWIKKLPDPDWYNS